MSMSRVLVRLALMLLAVHHTSQRDARAAEKEDPVPPLGSAEKERDCNNLQADVIFILDVSETMTQTRKCTELFFGGHECKNVTQANSDNFDTARIFIINLMYLTKDFVSPDFVRFGVVAFSYGGMAHSYLELSDKFYSDDVLKRLRNLPPAPSKTSAQDAVFVARTMLGGQFARYDVTPVIVLVTDGKSLSPMLEPLFISMQSIGIRFITLTVGDVDPKALDSISPYSDYLHSGVKSSSPTLAFSQLTELACKPLCAWNQDPCFPGQCGDQGLADHCQCAPGFQISDDADKRCKIQALPNISTCRLILRDPLGNEVMSKTTGSSQHCDDQQHGFMNIQPTSLTFDVKAEHRLSLGTFPSYVKKAGVGISGIKLTIVKVTLSGDETIVADTQLNTSPACSSDVNSASPAPHLDCADDVTFTHDFADGERLCVDVTAVAGGFYDLQDPSGAGQESSYFPAVSKTRRLCFTYDSTGPTHCSQVPGGSSCSAVAGSPLSLSTRLTRSADIRVVVDDGWMDVGSGVARYFLEVHEIHAAAGFLSVEEAPIMRKALQNDTVPHDVPVTLPSAATSTEAPRLYAVLLEVHDGAGNVAYARRFVLYDKNSRVVVNPKASLKVITNSNRAEAVRGRGSKREVCVEWKDRFYNDGFLGFDYLLPVKADTARGIDGGYDQTSGVLPVRGTASVRGVVKFEVSWSVDDGAQSAWQTTSNFPTESACLSPSAPDGVGYRIYVRATDIMNQSATDDVRVILDSTEPELEELGLKGRQGRTGLHVHDSIDLSTMVVVIEASDPHSGLTSLRWSLSAEGSTDDLASKAFAVQKLRNSTSCGAGKTYCYCPSSAAVGQCEIYRYEIRFDSLVPSHAHIGDHHRHYQLTVNAVNGAGLLATRTADILIDTSPPTVGVALEGIGPGGGAEVTGEEVDFTREGAVHVRWHGFRDPESGVVMYSVVLTEKCLSSVQEVEAARNVTEVTATAGSLLYDATLHFPAEGRYFTNVVAYNSALSPSPVACSDGIIYYTSAPQLLDVSIAQGRSNRALACTPATETEAQVTWMLSSALTRTRLPNTTKCFDVCRQRLATSSSLPVIKVDYLPLKEPDRILDEAEAEKLCQSLPMMTEDWWIVLPSDRLLITWSSVEEKGAIQEFYVGAGSSRTSSADLLPMTGTHRQHVYHNSRTGLGQGAVFFLFLRAVNKAGASTDLVLGPVLVDSTPPTMTAPLTVTAVDRDMNDVTVVWTQADIVDPEQPPHIDLKITYRIGHDDGFLTSFTPLNDADIADCQNRDASVHGCLRVPVDELRAHDTTAGRSFFFQLHVQNAAGLTAAFNTSSFRLPPRASHVMVLDILPSMAADWRNSASADVIEDVDVRLEPDVLCAAWTRSEPFDLLGHDVEFGVGHSKESDDVMPFVIADVVQNTACINATSAVPFYKTVYSLIRMTSTSGGSSMFFSDGFTVVPKQDPKTTDEVFTGKRCTENEMIHEEVFPTVQKPFTHTVNPRNAASFHAGDVMYVEFHPSVQHAAFPGAHVIHATLSGYQVVLTSHALTVDLPAETVNSSDNISIRIYACEKDVSLWRRKDSVFVSWELKGRQWKFARFLQVRLLEESCLSKRQSTSESTELCTLAESPLLSPGRREMTFDDVTLYAGISYVSSVAVCFDECLPAVLSRPFIVSVDQTMVDIYDANVQLQTTASSAAAQWDVTMEASVEPVLPGEPCYFLWAVARSGDGSRLLDDWKLHKENQCSRAKIADSVSFAGTARGTLYACIQPMYPRRASVPTCRKVTRSKTDEESDVQHSFHIIELSQNQLHRLNPSDFQLLQHDDGNKLRSLYDLDLDFAEADLVVAAALATVAKGGVSPQVAVTWFLMTSHAHVPENGECEADPECVTWHTSAGVNDSSVVFPKYRSRLENQEVYFVCALLSPLDLDNWYGGVSDVGEVCGDGFFVDEDPPSPGFVSIHNANDDGILSNSDRVLVTWSGFHDAEIASFGVNVLSYSVALGSYPSSEDIVSFTHVGKRTLWAFDDVNISPGLSCYATVRAQDMAGHVIQMSSEPVLFDDTPPTKGKVVVQGLTSGQRCLSSHQVLITWYEVTDLESGIARQEVGVGGHAHSERWQAANDVSMVAPFNVILRGNSYALNHLSAELVDGHSYVMLLKSTNHAGLTTVTSSEAVIADSSPPRIGTVQVDTSQHPNSKRDSLHPAHDVYRARWSGFVDPHCGIAYYRVALGSSPQQDDIVAFHYVGLRISYTWKWSPDAGGQYFALVEACNHAGLCSIASSHAFLVDPTPPTSGHVIVGANPRHSPYWGHDTFLVARWIGLFDPQSDVREFLWCVGRDPSSCDVTTMTSSMRERAALASGLSLPTSVPLYVTVVAENNAGQRTKRVSNRFFVDVSPPEVLESPTFVSTTTISPTTGQPDRSTLSLAWSFIDPDSPILTQTISVSGQGQGRHGLADPIVVALVAPDNKLTLQLDRDNLLMDGDVYTASVTACNAAELCTTAVSGPLLVDSTPPIIGTFEPEMKWEVVSGKSVTGSRGFLEDFVTLVHVAWSDFADEESGMSGYHLTVGRSYSGDELSGSSVFVSHNSSSRAQIFSLNINETFRSGDLLVFSLWAVNNPGLISPVLRTTFEVLLESASGEAGTLVQQRHSCAPYYCTNECTCSARGHMCQPSTETATPCRDLSSNKDFLSSGIDLEPRLGCPSCSLRFITSATCLEGHWTKPSNPDPSVYAIFRFQWSFSLAGSPPGVGVFDTADSPSVWHDAGLRTSVTYCLPGHRTLSSGSKYVLHVRAWLSRDSYFVQTSPPVATDHSTPVRRRGRSVRESVDVPACGTRNDVDFFSDGKIAALSACWDRVFSDEQSGIRSYDVWIGTLPFGDDYQRPQNVYLNTSIPVDTSSMIQGVNYYITVRAVNGAGLMSTVTSDGVMKDATPPVTGIVYTSARHTTRHVTDDVTTLHASWDGFYDLHSGLTSFFVALLDADDVNTPIVDFEPVKLRKAHRFGNLSLIHGHSYKVAVKAVDAAGLVSSTAWSAAILTDVTPPRGVTCQSFTLEAETTLVPTPQSSPASSSSSFHHERYHATLNAGLTSDLARSCLLKVALSATSLRPGARGEVTLDSGDISMPLVLQFHTFSNQSSAEHVLMVVGGQRSVSIAVHGNTGADITARLFSCSRVVLSDKEAVTIRQVSQTALSVCTTIADDESSVTALKIGVGTTPGGLQVQPLTSAVGGHGWLVTDASHVPHGTPLYAVVWARNLGNAWARFVSRDPVLFDLTPPVISGLDVTLTAAYDNGGRREGAGDVAVVDGGGGGPGEGDAGVLVTAVAVWSAVDEESGGVICTCSLVGHQTSDDVTQLLDGATVGRCQWKLRHLQHGSRVHVVVSCRNQVDIVSTKTSDDITVLIRPPDLSKISLRALNNYASFSPYDRAENLFRSSDSDLQFSWTGAHDPTVEQYQYRFTFNSAPLTGWSPLPPHKSAAILTKSEGRRGSVAAQVRALYRKELISEVVSAHVILHDAKPALTGIKATATVTNGRLRLDWAQVFSIDRNATFSVHAGTSEEFGDVINHYVTATSSYEGAFDKELHLLFVNIECVYYNGLLELYRDEIAL